MIHYKEFTLKNGLRVIVQEDKMSQIAIMNIMYQVGSRDEDEEKTGLAHLFEHLMFGGSKNIPEYDQPLQKVGGESNAYTNMDVTNYYCSLPAQNIETAFWLESDRMLSLSFDKNVLEVQKKVVMEEFKESYYSGPYRNAWLELCALSYRVHPYKWPTIGKDMSHIKNVTMEDVKNFAKKFYIPNNAVLVIAGNVSFEQVKKLAEKWFGPIPAGVLPKRKYTLEPKQETARKKTLKENIPCDAIYKAYHIPSKLHNDFEAVEILERILGMGASSRLHEHLVHNNQYFSSIDSYMAGSWDPGLLLIYGIINEGISIDKAENELQNVIRAVQEQNITEQELQKAKNQALAEQARHEMSPWNRAEDLAEGTLLGDPKILRKKFKKLQEITIHDVRSAADYLAIENSNTLYYEKGELQTTVS